MSRQVVEAPPATGPLYGLVIGAPEIKDTPPEVWGAGWTFAPEGCGNSGRVALNCAGSSVGARTPPTNPANVEGDPFLLWAADRCSTFGFAARDYQGRASRALAASESWQIANELWTGTLAQGSPALGNRWLTDSASDTLTNGPASALDAFADLVGALGWLGKGRVGMVHVTPQILVHLQDHAAVYRDGNIWRSPMGHRVIADDGYDGSGPGGTPATTSQWAYATSTIRTARGPVEFPGTFDEMVDREINSVAIYAQRLARYEWDECVHLAAEINVPRPLIGPPS